MADSFQVVSSGLFVANVSVDASVSCCSSEVLALSEGDVLAIRILEALGKPEIDNEDVILVVLRASHEEVIRLDVSVDDSLFMHFLNSHDL